jgi:serine/threonine-protein kinase PknG
MNPCNRTGCAGNVDETGFCDTCWRRPLPDPEEYYADDGRYEARHTAEANSTEPLRLPYLRPPDPADRAVADPKVPENTRYCGKQNCRAEVGRSYKRQPGLSEGFCPRCGTPFSFLPKLRPGELVDDRYEVVGCIARGGLGFVYLAKDLRLDGMHVALKGLINTRDEAALEIAVAERHFLTELDHPNIVRIFDFVRHPDPASGDLTGYIVMEYINGLSLREITASEQMPGVKSPFGGPLLVEHLIIYGREILAALDYLHGRVLLYCDMKPDNVIHTEDRIKLIDLGALRRVDDRNTPPVITPRYAVSREEIKSRGLTVRADLHTVGKTLREMFRANRDRLIQQDQRARHRPVAFGIGSFRRANARAAHHEYDGRFASASQMSEQLRGVLREIRSLREARPGRPEPSTVFAASPTLLDAGLGAVPALEECAATSGGAAGRWGRALADGCPTPSAVAVGLPVPHLDPNDPAAGFLAEVSATEPRRLIDKLATYKGPPSVEIALRECRACIELADLTGARDCLRRADEVLGPAGPYDWRLSWHRGLLELGEGAAAAAAWKFDEVYNALPGEDAPKVALGFCREQLRQQSRAEHCYRAVWQRDHSQVSAAFGLARICLARGDRVGAVRTLDEAPEVSRHYDPARIAAVRILAGRLDTGRSDTSGLPTAVELSEVVKRLPALYLDGGERDGEARVRLTAAVRGVALEWVCRGNGANGSDGRRLIDGEAVLGNPITERGLRMLLERSFRAIAGQARSAAENALLVDCANAVRPRTIW